MLASYETCLKDKRAFATNFHWIERNANAKIAFMQLSFKMSRYLRKAAGNASR